MVSTFGEERERDTSVDKPAPVVAASLQSYFSLLDALSHFQHYSEITFTWTVDVRFLQFLFVNTWTPSDRYLLFRSSKARGAHLSRVSFPANFTYKISDWLKIKLGTNDRSLLSMRYRIETLIWLCVQKRKELDYVIWYYCFGPINEIFDLR